LTQRLCARSAYAATLAEQATRKAEADALHAVNAAQRVCQRTPQLRSSLGGIIANPRAQRWPV
jgi:hypothetical protein